MTEFVSATAEIVGDYHYRLTRVWDAELPALTFVLLNPSTADALQLDPTMRGCVSFAKRDGFGGIAIANLYAFRATRPRDMLAAADPVGPANDAVLAGLSGKVVAGWGNHARPSRVAAALELLPPLHALGVNKGGQPRHPLYIHGNAALMPWPTWTGHQPD